MNADVIVLNLKQMKQGKIAHVMIRNCLKEGIKLDIKIMLLGEAGAGKTTLVRQMPWIYMTEL